MARRRPPKNEGGQIGSGRDGSGRFAPGNKLGRGNPQLHRVTLIRRAMESAVTQADVQEIVEALAREAKTGNVEAIREFFDRSIGKPTREIRALEGCDLGPPPRTLSELTEAHSRLIAMAGRGEISTEDAKLMSDMLGNALKVAELAELEQRIAQLERQSQRPVEDEP